MNEAPDSELVPRVRRGDTAAMEVLVRRYLRPAYLVALGVVRNIADAEDLAQESLMNALQRIEQCRDPLKFRSWLLQGVRNRALNYYQQGKTREALRDEAEAGAVFELDAGRVLLRKQLLAALSAVADVQREVVLLHDLEAWTHAEIAAALGISEVMSRQHLFVARKAMRALLTAEQKEHGHG